jgi:hypothetical protein
MDEEKESWASRVGLEPALYEEMKNLFLKSDVRKRANEVGRLVGWLNASADKDRDKLQRVYQHLGLVLEILGEVPK